MNDPELSLALGSSWLAQARLQDPDGYLERAWDLYVYGSPSPGGSREGGLPPPCAREPDEVIESALLSELAGALSPLALELRGRSEQARQMDAEDLLRAGMMALHLALESLRHRSWDEVRAEALRMAEEAMRRRAERPSPRSGS